MNIHVKETKSPTHAWNNSTLSQATTGAKIFFGIIYRALVYLVTSLNDSLTTHNWQLIHHSFTLRQWGLLVSSSDL